MKRRFLVLVGEGDIGLGLEQQRRGVQLPGTRSEVQRSLLVLVQRIHVDAGLEVFLEGRDRADFCGDINRLRRRLVALARHADAAEVGGQFPPGLAGGEVERGASFFVLGREIGLGPDEQLGQGELVVLRGVVQRRLFAFAPQVDIHAIGQCELRHSHLAAPDCDMQNRVAVLVLIVDFVPLGEEALDRLDIPPGSGLPNIGGRLFLRFFLRLSVGGETGHEQRRGGHHAANRPHYLRAT